MRVVIAEKKDQAEKLAAPFKSKRGDGYLEVFPCPTFPKGAYFTWCMGHLFGLADPESYTEDWKTWSLDTLPMLPEQFKYSSIKGKSKQFQVIKNLLKDSKVTEIIIGTDPGREGELIARSVIQMSGIKKPLKRLWTASLTQNAVSKAFSNLLSEEVKRPLYFEATARQQADWLVGLNTSRAYSILLKEKKINEVFSTGRVQTPLLALIVEREIEIENFKPSPFWEVYGDFEIKGNTFRGKWFKKDLKRLEDKNQAETLANYCKGKTAQIKNVKTDRKTFEPPMLFNLSALQILANKKYQYSPERVLEICQELYMLEFLSYPRSDSQHVTEEEAKTFPGILQKLGELVAYKTMIPTPVKSLIGNKRFVDPQSVSDHYAIIPTEQVPNLSDLTDEQSKIYDLVAKSLIAAHYEKAIFDFSQVTTIVDGKFTYETKGKAMVQEGWRVVIFPQGEKDGIADEEEYADIPPVSTGESGMTVDTELKGGMTKPPKHFTQGDLIPLMKSGGKPLEDAELEKVLKQTEGLGTEATRASIIKTLKDRNYIDVKKNMVYPTEKGRILIHAIGNSVLTSAELTAQWESRLREIGLGKASHTKFIEQAKLLAKKLVEDAIVTLKDRDFKPQVPVNSEQKPLEPQLNEKPAQPHQKPENAPVSPPSSSSEATELPAPPTAKQSPDKPFTPNKSAGKEGLGPCRKCQSEVVDKGNFYGCSSYMSQGCGFTISKTILGQTISPENIRLLLEKGETKLIEGFQRRSGTGTFKAVLMWDPDSDKLIFRVPSTNVYKMPLNLLKPLTVFETSQEELNKDFWAIEKEATALKYPAKVVGVKHGPRITRYELLPAKGINISGYKRFKANFQAALKAKRLTMHIPIPGSNHVGIEIPNKHPYPVQLRGLLENEEFQAKKRDLSIPIGMDLLGNPYFADLASMPHLLVAGTTGSGKSVFLNELITGLLYSCSPDMLKFLMIDPKQVELSVYADLPHLFCPIITEVEKAGKALDLLVQEMTKRYKILQQAGVRNISAYNEKMSTQDPIAKKMPYIVLIIDELADLMMTTADFNVEHYIVRLAQLARASGIHMVIATQRPTKQVISPLIKSNMPVRAAFAVAATSDSMTILDEPGAEDLLGQGDMLFMSKDVPKIRLQSGYVSDEEIEDVVKYLKTMYAEQVKH
ncbi:DNA topoisomerase 3 [Paenibacillus aestuarii]|uniref:DNA topoisomerase 3 n=1 Tax=Paenibacillus aestuarii TaxID=516965 RepID=A0ABW0K6L3_9BACL